MSSVVLSTGHFMACSLAICKFDRQYVDIMDTICFLIVGYRDYMAPHKEHKPFTVLVVGLVLCPEIPICRICASVVRAI